MKNPLKSIRNPFAKKRKSDDAQAPAGAPMFGARAEAPAPPSSPGDAAAASVDTAAASVDEITARLADPGTSFYGQKVASVAEVTERAEPAPSPSLSPSPSPSETSVGVRERAAPVADAPLPPVVEFRNVSKTYANGFTAIRDVTFCVDDIPGKGEFVCVLGPSGCGKSTILRLIAGLEPQHPPTTGEVLVAGSRVEGPGSDRGFVFQDYTSFDHRTVLDNIAFGLECRGVPKAERQERALEWIGKVGLSRERDAYKFPHQLSGGMRQRVAIARSLILSPRIILMDEPFGALDPATRLNMQDLLVSLWREASATVFFITHSVEEAVYLGDRVYIMSPCPGTILEEMTLPGATAPARVMQRQPDFLERVFGIRDKVERLEESTRAGT